MIKSKALEVNLADYHVEVTVDPKYAPLQEVMARYFGLRESLTTFLEELSHPYRNWRFIIKEARGYCLDYFHQIRRHPLGGEAAWLFAEIFLNAVENGEDIPTRADAADNLLLFLQKIAQEGGADILKLSPALWKAFERIEALPDTEFFLFISSFYSLKTLVGAAVAGAGSGGEGLGAVNRLLIRYCHAVYDYWLSERDPLEWFLARAEDVSGPERFEEIFRDISHARISQWRLQLAALADGAASDPARTAERLLTLPGHNQIMDVYRRMPQVLLETGKTELEGNHWKVLFLFHIMNMSGLAVIHEETLRGINRTMAWIIENEHYRGIQNLIRKTFGILKLQVGKFPATALNCVLNMGRGVYKTDDSELVNLFIDSVIDLGFQTPMITGVGDDWQIRVNKAHIQNIRVWLELIEQNPKWSTRLLSGLIIHLALFGVFIKDVDLFPRDITQFLNSDIVPVFNLAKQLARLFPVYFNDIGAEGRLRDISTRLDEISRRKDTLIHFLRKQSHVESSNRIVCLMDAVLKFWETRDRTGLEPFVPPDIYRQTSEDGRHVDGVHRAIRHLKACGAARGKGLPDIGEADFKSAWESLEDADPADTERVELAVILFQLLNQKYTIGFTELGTYIGQLRAEAFPELNRLREALEVGDVKKKLLMLLEYLELLKRIVLSPRTFEIREDIYKKRHITVDIPSMYGSYHEMKFDALGLMFRIESLVNVLFEQLVDAIELSMITKATFYDIFASLRLFDKALRLDGIHSNEIERQLDFLAHSLEIKGFTFTQYIDIFKGFSAAVRNIINDYFHNIHDENLNRVLAVMPGDAILPKYVPHGADRDPEKLVPRVSEIFARDRIALSLGLQQLDLLIGRILNTLYRQSSELPKDKLHQLLLYDPENAMTPIYHASNRVSSIIHLGNKGQNLVKIKEYGLPVPPGFIITTEVFRVRRIIEQYRPAEANFREQVARHVAAFEAATGKAFGDPRNPLLFSVRSGASISQPGMMDTFLNVGINEEIAAGIASATGNPWFAWDNYRRFLQGYGMAFGLHRDGFDATISHHKKKAGIPLKRGFSGDQMRQVALAYRGQLGDAGITVEKDPFALLHTVIKMVMASWESPKARTYRRIMGISDDWGTAVTVQAMVFGNKSRQSGTGVIFTHDPRWSADSLRLWGDFTIGNQGEDVVSGLVQTLPISIRQQEVELRETDITLETHFPLIFNALREWSKILVYRRGWSPQEIEFTFEGPEADNLYILQTRDMAMRERKSVLAFEPQEADGSYLGHGIGVSGGAMGGRIVFTLEEIDRWRQAEPDTALVLVRGDTVPDDILEIYSADGLLTARGGLTSHAAVVAHRLGRTCVVGCGDLVCNEREKTCTFNRDQELSQTGFEPRSGAGGGFIAHP